VRYERACSQLAAAKEMVNLAEQGYFKQTQQFDPAWQEMLNHSTMKVTQHTFVLRHRELLWASFLCGAIFHCSLFLWLICAQCL